VGRDRVRVDGRHDHAGVRQPRGVPAVASDDAHDGGSDPLRELERLDRDAIERTVRILAALRRRGGRLFVVGVGGSAGNASHAVNDFRKIVGIEAYTPTDNVSELTARVNDDGWDSSFSRWLEVSRLGPRDVLFVLSVGGGAIVGIVGRDGGDTARLADACVVVPTVDPDTVTPHTEAFQSVIWHLLVSHPELKQNEMKWESVV
jgi:D-sedoheptulose 7-phosphate isomerase